MIAVKSVHAVFDPYMGVGSSVIAALMRDRIGYGCDIVPEYVETAWQRVNQWREGVLKTHPMGKPIYDSSLRRLWNRKCPPVCHTTSAI